MRDWQYAWGTKKDGTEWHHMTFFTEHGHSRFTNGNPPSFYNRDIIASSDYDDCMKPTAWEPV